MCPVRMRLGRAQSRGSFVDSAEFISYSIKYLSLYLHVNTRNCILQPGVLPRADFFYIVQVSGKRKRGAENEADVGTAK